MKRVPLPVRFGGGRYRRRPPAPPFALRADQLAAPLQSVARVGPVTARRLASLGIGTVGELLEHYPRRYEDFRERRLLADLKLGEEATVRVILERIALATTRRRGLQVVRATVRDHSGVMEAVWFNQGYLATTLEPGTALSLRATLRHRGGQPSLLVRGHDVVGDGEEALHTEGVVPVYPAGEEVSARLLRSLIHQVLPLARRIPDPLPVAVRRAADLPARCDALVCLHAPHDVQQGWRARRRFIFEELFLLQVGVLVHKAAAAARLRAPALDGAAPLSGAFVRQLPFAPTADQRAAVEEISTDLARETPMRRLLQGDVGSGKTVVALHALLRAADHGRQGALLVPTETLAAQHLDTVASLAGDFVRCELLTAGLGAARHRAAVDAVASGEAQIVVGTHALLQERVRFHDLAVVVVDEQHRFGVVQRDKLVHKAAHAGRVPHLLAMTATPIPRTLALTLYGDLDVTLLKAPPAGRRPVHTEVLAEGDRQRGYALARHELDAGRQVYVVCPTIDESESVTTAAAVAEADRLREGELTGYKLAVLHGQMRPDERRRVMTAFKAGEIQALVATSVIEVGVDVPNATVMIVEGAERFGLAQLHQLRGRVGRGAAPSTCILFTQAPTEQATQRLLALVRSSDGFELADRDLEIRGEGHLFGTRQSGLPDLRVARLLRDRQILLAARKAAQGVVATDPLLRQAVNRPLRDAVRDAFGGQLAWVFRA